MLEYEIKDTGDKSLLGFRRYVCNGMGFTGYGKTERDAYLEWSEAKYIGEKD